MTLQELLTIKDNDYSEVEQIFNRKTGLSIVSGYNKHFSPTKSCSIIVPFFERNSLRFKKCLLALQNQALPSNYKKNKVELVIINDGAPVDLRGVIKKLNKFYPVIYLRLSKNCGTAIARDLGLLHAQNEIIVFLDSDTVVLKYFLSSHLLRHEFVDNCAIVGFHQKINLDNPILDPNRLRKGLPAPDYKDDFRYKKFIPDKWRKVHTDVLAEAFNKTYYLLKESNYFKDFGEGKILGVWDLPFMFLTGNTSVPRRYVLEVGGFDTRFKGWALEDTHLGAKLIARGLYLIPNLHATAYHIKRKVEKKRRNVEFRRNLRLYKELKQEKIVYFKESEWKERMKNYFEDKTYQKIRLNA